MQETHFEVLGREEDELRCSHSQVQAIASVYKGYAIVRAHLSIANVAFSHRTTFPHVDYSLKISFVVFKHYQY